MRRRRRREKKKDILFLFSESPFHISPAYLLLQVKSKTSLIHGPSCRYDEKKKSLHPERISHRHQVWSKREERKTKCQITKPLLLLPASPLDIVVSIITSQENRGFAHSPPGINIQKKENPPSVDTRTLRPISPSYLPTYLPS